MSEENVAYENYVNARYVTGIMTANGTVDLGFTPSAVIVKGAGGASDGYNYNAQNFGIALYGHAASERPDVAGYTTIEIVENGFTTTNMHAWSANGPSAREPIYYIAFK